VTIILFLIILLVNMVFWVAWVKMMFYARYLKIKDWLARKCCKGKFSGIIQGDSNDIAEINAEKIKEMGEEEVIEDSVVD
jgi:hypothetical protein